MKLISTAVLIATVAAPSIAHAACFSMFDAKNSLVYQSTQPPIDLSRSIAGEMQRQFPNYTMIVSDPDNCTEINNSNSTTKKAPLAVQRTPYTSPLLRKAQDVQGTITSDEAYGSATYQYPLRGNNNR